MKRLSTLLIALLLLFTCLPAQAEEEVIPPAWPVPDYVTWLLEIAGNEVGYKEGDRGYTKFGEWAGNPYAQWCAEYLCWSVDQVDQLHGTSLLHNVYPLYSGQNTGKNWFIKQGRYISRNGNLEDWGYQWFRDESEFIKAGEYIPQPGDWVFFTWTSDTDTDHVAMVEYCTRRADGGVTIHCLEGNNPSEVARVEYDVSNKRILGYGTVHDVADWTMRQGNTGEKVRQLQDKLVYLSLLSADMATGYYGQTTADVISAYQKEKGLKVTGIANIDTQAALDKDYSDKAARDPSKWVIIDDEVYDD